MRQGRPKWRCLQFSLRTFLGLVLFSSVGLGWCASTIDAARREEQLVRDFCEVLTSAGYEISVEPTAAPCSRLMAITGREGSCFRFLACTVDVSDHKRPVKDLLQLFGLETTYPERVALYGSKFNDSHLKLLAGLSRLTELKLISTSVSDSGLAEFRHARPQVELIVKRRPPE